MEVVYARCAALDLHKKDIKATVMTPGSNGKPRKETRSFGTMTEDLRALAAWLGANQVTHVAMESTGVYWKPVWNELEGKFHLLLVNAQHVKAVPGRKTDVKDSEWLCDLLRHGLLRPSYVPNRAQRELRELTRYRTSLVRERSTEVNRVQKTLEGANIKLASVASDTVGASGRAMLQALIDGTTDPKVLAELAEGKLRKRIPELIRALEGQMGAHQRFLLGQQLEHIDLLDEQINRVSREITERLRPFEEQIALLDTIPGVGRRIAEIILAELGTAPEEHFPSAAHASSWAGLAPGNNESAGKRKSGKARKGNLALKTALVEAAQAAAHGKHTYLAAQYHRLAARRGKKRAIVALAHMILVIAYEILKHKEPYHDLGEEYRDERSREALTKRLVAQLVRLGKKVTLEPITLPEPIAPAA